MRPKIFVDGQFGTTGLKIREMLHGRDDIKILSIAEDEKKDPKVKQRLLDEADLVFLCLPDSASKESVALINDENTRVIDASTAHRTDPEWVYGIPELDPSRRTKIKESKRVCVPGCHASGFIMAMNPLLKDKTITKEQKLICHSITGYSGGGKGMIDLYEAPENSGKFESQRPYALGLDHKHLPEMKYVLGLDNAPFFTPSVGNFDQGMLVMSYLIKDELLKKMDRETLLDKYETYYKDEPFVRIVHEKSEAYLDSGFLDAMRCNNTNRIEISVYENESYLLVVSRLDNLGKGASGAAVQNMNIMLGFDETRGLKA